MVKFEFDGLVEITAGDGKMTIGAELATRELLEIAYEAVDAANEIADLEDNHETKKSLEIIMGELNKLRYGAAD